MCNLVISRSLAPTPRKTSFSVANIWAWTANRSRKLRNQTQPRRRERRPLKMLSKKPNRLSSQQLDQLWWATMAIRKIWASRIWIKLKRKRSNTSMRNSTIPRQKENGPSSTSTPSNWLRTQMMKKMSIAVKRILSLSRWNWMIELRIQWAFAIFPSRHGSNSTKQNATISASPANLTNNRSDSSARWCSTRGTTASASKTKAWARCQPLSSERKSSKETTTFWRSISLTTSSKLISGAS